MSCSPLFFGDDLLRQLQSCPAEFNVSCGRLVRRLSKTVQHKNHVSRVQAERVPWNRSPKAARRSACAQGLFPAETSLRRKTTKERPGNRQATRLGRVAEPCLSIYKYLYNCQVRGRPLMHSTGLFAS